MSTCCIPPLASPRAPLEQIALAVGAAVCPSVAQVSVTGIRHDSRRVQPGDLFVARRGEHADGVQFVPQAIQAGAVAILAQRDHVPAAASVPVLIVDDVRLAIGQAAAAIYGDPGRTLQVVGITGTNGKTTTSYLTCAALRGAGCRPGVLGTLGAHFDDLDFEAGHTTPEADEIMRMAAAMRDRGASHLVMEVSSHALAQRRADALRFRVAAFTNLTRDHLDYHGTLEAYGQAKERLFVELQPQAAVINVDDEFGVHLASMAHGRLLTYSRHSNARAEVRPISPVQHDARGLSCEIATPSGPFELHAPLVGDHNLSNLLLSVAIVSALDLPLAPALAALQTCSQVPGRLERCDDARDDIMVLVDYAHTPDALERALATLRPLARGKLVCVFGAGGDRDTTKRPLMGEAVGRLADVAVLTNDNPRSERPEDIANQVLQGLKTTGIDTTVELDRERAIALAIDRAEPGDVVLIAGKGHETYQILGPVTRHFDDRQQARAALASRRARRHDGDM